MPSKIIDLSQGYSPVRKTRSTTKPFFEEPKIEDAGSVTTGPHDEDDPDSDRRKSEQNEEDENDEVPLIIDQEGDLIIQVGNKTTGVGRFLVSYGWLASIPKWSDILEQTPSILPQQQASDVHDCVLGTIAEDEEIIDDQPSPLLDEVPGQVDPGVHHIILDAGHDTQTKTSIRESVQIANQYQEMPLKNAHATPRQVYQNASVTEIHETIPTQGYLPIVYLPDDHPEAVGIALLVIHLKIDLLPPVVDFDTIYELALHCEKLGIAQILTPCVTPWIDRLLPLSLKVGSPKWLYIAWVFEINALFEAHMQNIVCTSSKVDGKLDVDLLSAVGHGQELLDVAAELREEMIRSILSIVVQYMDEDFWYANFTCNHINHITEKAACSEHAYVSFAVKLRALHLWPTVPAVSDINDCPRELREKLYGISLIPSSEDHRGCLELIDLFKEKILFVPYDPHGKHLARYREHFRTGLEDMKKFRLTSLMGAYLYDYGFTSADVGTTSIVKSANRRRGMANFYERYWSSMQDHLSDNEDSDYELPSDDESEPEDEFWSHSRLEVLEDLDGVELEPQSRRRPLADLGEEQPCPVPKKKAQCDRRKQIHEDYDWD